MRRQEPKGEKLFARDKNVSHSVHTLNKANKASKANKQKNALLRKIGMVVAPLQREVSATFSSLISGALATASFGTLLDAVETFPPLRMRLRFAPSMLGKLIFPSGPMGGGLIDMMRTR
jgi:hypothetical protein